jgi:signal transduction histidine kinase
VAVAGLLVAGLLAAVGALEYLATRREYGALVRAQAVSVRDTVAAAARANRTAAAEAEAELVERLLDNARMLTELDRLGALTPALLQEVAARHALFRVTVLAASGAPEASASGPDVAGLPRTAEEPPAGGGRRGPGPWGPGPGPRSGRGLGSGAGGGPATAALVEGLLSGAAREGATPLHTGRRTGIGRLAAGVARAGGGAILVSVDASDIARLKQQASLDRLLEDIVSHTADVAYITFEQGAVRRSRGETPPAPDGMAAGEATEREVLVAGRPVLEIVGPVSGLGEEPAHLRLGMRLDEVRRAERRTLVRLAGTLSAAGVVGALALGLMGLSRRYGTLSAEHARAQEALRRRDRLAAMGELASTVAHEIRNPLNAIAMSAQRLRREWVDSGTTGNPAAGEEARGLVAVVEDEARRLDAKVQQFLEFARPPALAPRPVPLQEWLAGAAAAAAPLAAERSVRFVVAPSDPRTVVIDVEQLRQALDNVIRNAIDATPPGGTVAVEARVSPPWLWLDVRDEGPGIHAEDRPRIFDLYFTTKSGGTGVGLAVTQQIVAAHGGRIDVESAPGAGTTMRLRVPLEGAPPNV